MPNDYRLQKIWPPAEAFYIQSMLFNSRAAVASVERVSAIFKAISEGTAGESGGEAEMDEILNHLQNIVINGAALSRYLWPPRKAYKWRGIEICEALDVSSSSPLKSRDLRNDIEHFDERLDEYLNQDIVGYILPQYVGRSVDRSGVPGHLFRAYFVDTGVFELLGRQYEIPPIAEEIFRIHKKLIYCLAHGGRLSPAS